MTKPIRKAVPLLLCVIATFGGCADARRSPASSAASSRVSSAVGSEPEAVRPVRTPPSIGTMTAGRLFYKPKESGIVRVADISGESPEIVLALRCLQGLVCREDKAVLYLKETPEDEERLLYLESEYGVRPEPAAPEELFKTYRNLVTKLVFYDPDRPELREAVLTAAACENALPLPKSLLPVFEAWDYSADFALDLTARWKDANAAYAEVYSEYAEACNPNYVFVGGADSPFADYAYAVKCFFLNVSAADLTVPAVLPKLLKRLDERNVGAVFGRPETRARLTSLVSEYGFVYADCADRANVTYLMSLPLPAGRYAQPPAVDRKAVRGKRYLAAVFYDSAASEMGGTKLQNLWRIANADSLPFGIRLNPALAEFSPSELQWYYQNRSSHGEILSTETGFGAADETKFPPALLPEWTALQREFLTAGGIRETRPRGEESALSASSAAGKAKASSGGEDAAELFAAVDMSTVRSETVTSKEELAAFFTRFASDADSDDEPVFCVLYVDTAGFEPENLWASLKLAVAGLKTELPGKAEVLLPGDLAATAEGYARARVAAADDASSAETARGEKTSSHG